MHHSLLFQAQERYGDTPLLLDVLKDTKKHGSSVLKTKMGHVRMMAWKSWGYISIWVNIDMLPYNFSKEVRERMNESYRKYLQKQSEDGDKKPSIQDIRNFHFGPSTLKIEIDQENCLFWLEEIWLVLNNPKSFERIKRPGQ